MDEQEARELRQELRDSDPTKRVAAVERLAEADNEAVVPFVYGALEDRNLDVRRAAMHTLMALRPGVGILTAIEKAASFDPGERSTAVEILCNHPDERALTRLHGVAEDEEEDAEVRAMALRALGKIGEERTIPVVIGLLESEHPPVRIAALQVLRTLPFEQEDSTGAPSNGHMDIARQLGAALTETKDQPEVHAEIARTLGTVAGWFSLPRLAELLDDERPIVRAAAVDAVAGVDGAKTHDELPHDIARLAFKEKDPMVRIAVARAAVELKLRDTADGLVKFLKDDDPEVRLEAVKALHKLKAKSAVKALKKLQDDESEDVQKAVEKALKKLED